MGILEHVWGVSSAQDRVWAHVSGISPRKAGASCLVVLQAFIDESVSTKGMFVLAGHIATAEAWACFAKDWEELLPYAVRDKNGEFNFKMRDMALSPDRMSRVPAFYKVIEKYALLSVSCGEVCT